MKKDKLSNESLVNVFCAISLFIAIASLPIVYYTFLRVIVFAGCILIIISKNVHVYWKLLFVPIMVLFNPLYPVYLYLKPYWIPLDILAGILFLLTTFYNYNNQKEKKKKTKKQVINNRNMYKIKH